MITAAFSGEPEVAEELLSYFVDIGNKECFAALLYICFDLLSPDVVEELSWQHALNDFYMPYRIQVQRSLVEKVCSNKIFRFLFQILTRFRLRSLKRKSRSGRRKIRRRNSRKRTRRSSNLVASVVAYWRTRMGERSGMIMGYLVFTFFSASSIVPPQVNGTGYGLAPVSLL